MIFDSINHLQYYSSFLSRLKDIDIFMKEDKFKYLQNGKHEIGDGLFVLLMEYNTKTEEEALWEAHRKFYDVQIVLRGEEKIAHSNIKEMFPSNEYVESDDYQLFNGRAENYLNLRGGSFVLFAPHDVHKTSIISNETNQIKKLVFKIRV